MQAILKRVIEKKLNNLKSSPKFGKDEVVSKSTNNFSKNLNNLRVLLKERRFLYFTKKGPIEIVFNIKHYLTALAVALIFLFKLFQFLLFGLSSFFNYAVYKNSEINSNKFTKTEIEALKNIANDAIQSDNNSIATTEDFELSEIEENQIDDNFIEPSLNQGSKLLENKDKHFKEDKVKISEKIREKFINIKSVFSRLDIKVENQISHSDEVILNQFSDLASPEMVAIEHTMKKIRTNDLDLPRSTKEKVFSYNVLPVVPFTAPRTNKLKIIHFTKKLDQEILQLLQVFKKLNLQPDEVNVLEIENLIKMSSDSLSEQDLISSTSLRFQYLEELKYAMIFLPLKPPMQYYYVSSPYGLRIHPKTKKKQMHHGIDMAGTWQEEIRASADGYIAFSGRNGSFGKSIKIVHKHSVTTLYGHLHKLMVKKGEFVKEGQVIGKMGATGRAVGAHLHYEIKVNNKSVNPSNFISIGRELISSSILKK